MKKILLSIVTVILLSLCIAFAVSAAGASASVNNAVANPGDTVEFTVSVSGSVSARSGAVSLEYDPAVLELVSGECLLKNASVTNFDMSTEKGAFLYTSATTVRGGIFKVKFKVLNTASFGTTQVKLILALKDGSNADISVSNSAGTLTVKRECNFIMQNTASKYLKKAANCTEPAVYYYSCDDCGDKGSATFASGEALGHAWKSTMSSDASNHWYACTRSGCTAVNQKEAHYGGNASCTQQATCEGCGKLYGGSASHQYTVLMHDELWHWKKCASCEATSQKEPHGFGDNHICDTCEFALNIPTAPTVTITVIQGNMTTTMTPNKDSQVTVVFADREEYAFAGWEVDGTIVSVEKTYTFTATEDVTVKAVYELLHLTHIPGETWEKDDNSHWHICTECEGQKLALGEHVYDDACDGTCNTCGYERAITHDYSVPVSDGEAHWSICTLCQKEDTTSREAHTGGKATCIASAICETCGTAYGTADTNAHSYDDGCDEKCNLCGQERVGSHDFSVLVSDGEAHWNICALCQKEDSTSRKIHSSGKATCIAPAICETCGTAYGTADANAHSYDDGCDESCNLCGKARVGSHDFSVQVSNGEAHWSICALCQKEDATSRKAHTGGKATCIAPATCETCGTAYGEADENAHSYDDGCDESCNLCGKARVVSHDFSVLVSDGEAHWKICALCQKEDTTSREAHSGGTATCIASAICETCGTAYGTADTNAHSYDNGCDENCNLCGQERGGSHNFSVLVSNGEAHWNICALCQKEDTTSRKAHSGGKAACIASAICETCGTAYGTADANAHSYDDGCDENCNLCGKERAGTHDFAILVSGKEAHWKICALCQAEEPGSRQAHTSASPATETEPELCTECGCIVAPATGHTVHVPADAWSSDGSNHWKECTRCAGQRLEAGEHVYDNACDTTCNTCGDERVIRHDFAATEKTDTEHWQECACGEVANKSLHTYDEDNICTVCGVETKAPVPVITIVICALCCVVFAAGGFILGNVLGKKKR